MRHTGHQKWRRRLAFVYVPNGIIMTAWTPVAEGRDYEMTRRC
ncbi:MAG: hypothetical protein QM757_31435 [Paludibaculum sp.]